MAQAPTLELRLFGVGTITKAGKVIVLATRKALALIAYLALEGTTTRGKLAWLLWSDLPEEAARNNLRKELFRLRETNLGTDLEITANQVTLKNFSSDVQEFNRLAGQSNEQALELTQHIFLDGIELKAANEFENWIEQRRQSFRQTTIGLWVTRASRLETQSDFRNALEARLALVHLDALQEVHHREVMRLHWLLGEQASALERFDTLERILKTELGLKPLPESLELLKKIQNTIPEIVIIPQIRQRPNLSRPPLVGREIAWHFLETQQQSFCLITGETGIGKTRLATDYATANGGYLNLRGYASAANTPFYPIAEALRSGLTNQRIDPCTMDSLWRNEIARLVPEFADQTPSLGSSFDGRAKFIESLARAIQIALRHNETLILDDLHWFDPSSLELIAHLARHNTKIIATARDLETSDNPSAQILLQTLEREGQLSRHALSHLNQNQTQMLLQTLSGKNAPLFTQRLQIASGGNPLLTLETLQGFFENGSLSLEPDGTWKSQIDSQTSDYTELPIPNNVRELVLGRIIHLGAAVKRILEVATLCATPFVSEDLLQASALSEWEAVSALERAVTAQLLTREKNQYRFKHDVVRRSLLEEFTPERQNLIHKRLAEQLIRSGSDPSRTAHHLEQSGRRQEAIPHLIKAALAARNLFAHQEARTIYDHALELQPDKKTEFSLHAQIAELELTLFNLDALEQHAQTMQALSHALPLEYSVKASLLTAKAQLYRGQFKQALETATQTLEDSVGEARAEALLLIGTALAGTGSVLEAKEKLLEGLQIQKRGVIAAELHSSLKEVYRRLGDLPQALEQAEYAHGIYKTLKNREQEITELAQIGQLLGLLGRSEEALERLQRATKQAREYGLDRVLSVALVLYVELLVRQNELNKAEEAIELGLQLTRKKMVTREIQLLVMSARVQYRKGNYTNAVQGIQALPMGDEAISPMQAIINKVIETEIFIAIKNFDAAKNNLSTLKNAVDENMGIIFVAYTILNSNYLFFLGQNQLALQEITKLKKLIPSLPEEYKIQILCAHARILFSQKQIKTAQELVRLIPFGVPKWLETQVLAVQLLADEQNTDLLKKANKMITKESASVFVIFLCQVIEHRLLKSKQSIVVIQDKKLIFENQLHTIH
jgi:DNA-binding SARP family transcriptional activator